MRVRKMDANGDRVFGGNLNAFFINDVEGVGQIIGTRLRLWQGQWFLDTAAGMPWETRVLGKYTGSTRDAAMQNQILTTPGVLAISAYSSGLNRDTRVWTVNAQIDTIYGTLPFSGPF